MKHHMIVTLLHLPSARKQQFYKVILQWFIYRNLSFVGSVLNTY